jgi:two-component system, chemotaxis family, protein-glutamate methylesterase/glutaminase
MAAFMSLRQIGTCSSNRGVFGVVLTGNLDDGTAGLWAIKDRGGIAIVQDPEEAMFPPMPRSALANVAVDYRLRLDEIALTLTTLSAQPATGGAAVSDNLEIETRIALEDNALEVGVLKFGKLSPFTCPECHGILLQVQDGQLTRFRCHTGHAYSVNSLLEDVITSIEQNLWSTVRIMDEHLLLLRHIHGQVSEQDDTLTATRIGQHIQAIRQRKQLVRQALLQAETSREEQADA